MVALSSALITPTGAGSSRVLAEAISHNTVEFDIRNSQFAGGAPMNGIDDDAPALRAAAQFFKTVGATYTGGKPETNTALPAVAPTAAARVNVWLMPASATVSGATGTEAAGAARPAGNPSWTVPVDERDRAATLRA